MLDKLRRARTDLATMKALLPEAERIARDDGVEQPGAEHLLLAALDLDDVATDVLRVFAVDQAGLRAAVAGQHEEALRAIGLVADDNAIAAALPTGGQPSGPYRSQGSLQTAFRHAIAAAKRDDAPLNSGHVLLAVTDAEHGTVLRALEHLGVDPTALRDTTRRALAPASSAPQGVDVEGVDVEGVDVVDHAERSVPRPSGWNADPTADHPIGPDDAGNAVMYGIGILARGWHRLVGKLTDRARPARERTPTDP